MGIMTERWDDMGWGGIMNRGLFLDGVHIGVLASFYFAMDDAILMWWDGTA